MFLSYATTLCWQSEKQFPDCGIGTELSFHAILNIVNIWKILKHGY